MFALRQHLRIALPMLTLGAALLAAACSGTPDYGDVPFLCGTGGECPDGYRCRQSKVCVRDGYQGPIPGIDAGTQSPQIPGSQNPPGSNPVGGNPGAGYTPGPGGSVSQIPGSGIPAPGGSNGSGINPPPANGGPWGAPCFLPADCPTGQKCAFFYNRCCDPFLNNSCL